MAEPASTGMDKAEMKRLLKLSAGTPLGCAVGGTADRTLAALLIDRVQAPKKVMQELEALLPALSNGRWGTVEAEPEGKARTVRFRLNKPVSGLRKRLVKTLKGTGYSRIDLVF